MRKGAFHQAPSFRFVASLKRESRSDKEVDRAQNARGGVNDSFRRKSTIKFELTGTPDSMPASIPLQQMHGIIFLCIKESLKFPTIQFNNSLF